MRDDVLQAALSVDAPDVGVIQTLLEHGADVNVPEANVQPAIRVHVILQTCHWKLLKKMA